MLTTLLYFLVFIPQVHVSQPHFMWSPGTSSVFLRVRSPSAPSSDTPMSLQAYSGLDIFCNSLLGFIETTRSQLERAVEYLEQIRRFERESQMNMQIFELKKSVLRRAREIWLEGVADCDRRLLEMEELIGRSQREEELIGRSQRGEEELERRQEFGG